MPLPASILSLSPGQLLDLFDLDLTPVGGGMQYFHSGLNQLAASVVWRGITYQPWPITADGFELSTGGKLPRPQLTVSNVFGTVTALLLEYGDLIDCVLTRHQTFAEYIDAVNFPGGVNASADPSQELPQEIWYIARKVSEDALSVVFQLGAAIDRPGIRLPRRQCNKSICSAVYQSPDCGYVPGPMFDANGNPVTDPSQDVCSHQLATGCKPRFYGKAGTKKGITLPFGGFPGAGTGAGLQ